MHLMIPQVETFVSVAESGSFNKAAEKLFMSPPAIMKQINQLEKILGTQLFFRTSKGIKLTRAGEVFYDSSQVLMKLSQDAISNASKAGKEQKEVIRVMVTPLHTVPVLFSYWNKISAKVPDMRLQIVPGNDSYKDMSRYTRTLGKTVDIMEGSYDQSYLQGPTRAAFTIAKHPLNCVVHSHSELAEKSVLVIEDLYGKKVYLNCSGVYENVDKLHNFIQKRHPYIDLGEFECLSLNAIVECTCESGVLVGPVHQNMIPSMWKVIPIDWGIACEMEYGFMHPDKPSKKISTLLSVLKNEIEINPPDMTKLFGFDINWE